MLRPLAAVCRAYHLAALLDAVLGSARTPAAAAALRVERHVAGLLRRDAARIVRELLDNPSARELLRDRWVPPERTLTELLAFPDGSLGRAYGEHVRRHDVVVEDFPDLDFAREDEFVRARLHQVDALVRVLCGYGDGPADEVAVLGLYLAQSLHHRAAAGALSSGAGLLASTALLRAAVTDRARLHPYAEAFVEGYLRGREAHCLFGPRWEALLDQPLDALRAAYRLVPHDAVYTRPAPAPEPAPLVPPPLPARLLPEPETAEA